MTRNGVDELTDRERQLLDLYIIWGRYRTVAQEMGLAESSVKNLAATILKVLEVNAIGQACVVYDRCFRPHG